MESNYYLFGLIILVMVAVLSGNPVNSHGEPYFVQQSATVNEVAMNDVVK